MNKYFRISAYPMILIINSTVLILNGICLVFTIAFSAYLGWNQFVSKNNSDVISGMTSSVVLITALSQDGEGQYHPLWSGSGSIISSDGLILTNAHVAMPDRFNPVDLLQISITEAPDQPPQPTCFATLVQADPRLDLAVLKIQGGLTQTPLNKDQLKFSHIPLGDSDKLKLGDGLIILGYPDIGGETITMTRGEVSGFTYESPFGHRAFIKTSASITSGNSGGLVADESGTLVGIPTQIGYGRDDKLIDCRHIADTNDDGIIDDRDACIPIGGFINALRPIKLALPIIQAAKRGEINLNQVSIKNGVFPTGRNVLLSDDFSNPDSGWMLENDTKGSARYQNGQYVLEVKSDQYLYWSLAGKSFNDVVIQVDAHILHKTGHGDFGAICRYQNSDNFYLLEVTEDGYFGIARFNKGNHIWLQQWEKSDFLINMDNTMTIRAACIGEVLSLGINDKTLAQVKDESFHTGDIGLIAGTWDEPNFVIAFDNLEIKSP